MGGGSYIGRYMGRYVAQMMTFGSVSMGFGKRREVRKLPSLAEATERVERLRGLEAQAYRHLAECERKLHWKQ